MSHAKRGFTLLELAVVITVIGLIAAGAVLGQDLIRQAQIRSTISDIEMYTKAIGTFKDKYGQLPGDFKGATAIWGANGACPPACTDTLPASTNTCDGNGDGIVGSILAISTLEREWRYAWQHLANSGLVDGRYTGSCPVGGVYGHGRPGINIPKTSIGSGIAFFYLCINNFVCAEDVSWPMTNYNHVLMIGASDFYASDTPVLTGTEALSIDKKIDDGMPGTGKVLAPMKTSTLATDCTTSNVQNTMEYDVTVTTPKCVQFIKTGY